MERFLQDIEIWCWRYKENIHSYPGVNLTATPTGCDALLKVIDLLKSGDPGARRTVPLKPLDPRDEAKITGGQKYRSFTKLRICLMERSADLYQMCISHEGDLATIEIVPEELEAVS